jgi:ClpP class serine protease
MPNWGQILREINDKRNHSDLQANEAQANKRGAVDAIRRDYLDKLFRKTGRNVIAYYSGWLSKGNDLPNLDIVDEDKNGFMMAVHQLKKSVGLDLILHTPGGHIAATQSIVDYLHKIFKNDIRCIVPQIAMSAGTMIACSAKSIVMAKHSNLGPIDPQFGGIPAYGVIEEFKKAYSEIKKDPDKINVWRPILNQYHPTFLGECQQAIKWSNDFVTNALANNMFSGDADAKNKAQKVVRSLTNYKQNRGHSRHIHIDECIAMGLKIEALEDMGDEMQDLILTVHHCYMHSLMNTASFKMIENHLGVAFVKQQQIVQVVANGPV